MAILIFSQILNTVFFRKASTILLFASTYHHEQHIFVFDYNGFTLNWNTGAQPFLFNQNIEK